MILTALLFALHVTIASDDADPVLLVDPGIRILFPEHVTVRERNRSDAVHLYLYRPGANAERPAWKRAADSLQYERELSGNIHMLARAKIESDGLLLHYEFTNRSSIDYEMINAVTDPRMGSIFHDPKLERTYVHHPNGFELLASEHPTFTLPARFLASYTWPVPKQLVEVRDGITHYYKSKRVDEPFIATRSSDGKWVAASFTRDTGNVWSNPDLTCQHVDPQKPLPAHSTTVIEVKFLVMRGTLEDAYRAFQRQRDSLK
jgi:hypothetical protein